MPRRRNGSSERPGPDANAGGPFEPLPRRFYDRDAPLLARALLGCILVHEHARGRTAGMIVETEAYEQNDPASHSFPGPTERNRVMFGPGGFAYVYRSYGVHWCTNIVSGPDGFGSAVLLRALAPLEGLELMRRRRGAAADTRPDELARGPGRLSQAMGVDLALYGADMTRRPFYVAKRAGRPGHELKITPRIGISKATGVLWRFCLAGHPAVSGPKAWR